MSRRLGESVCAPTTAKRRSAPSRRRHAMTVPLVLVSAMGLPGEVGIDDEGGGALLKGAGHGTVLQPHAVLADVAHHAVDGVGVSSDKVTAGQSEDGDEPAHQRHLLRLASLFTRARRVDGASCRG